jgi:agmatine deiminase
MTASPARLGFTLPAEWAPQAAIWLAWPAAADLWEDNLAPAQAEFVAFAQAIAWAPDGRRATAMHVAVADEVAERAAERALRGLPVTLHRLPYGDIWFRDTAPLFLQAADGSVRPACFRFNGWGGKYVLEHDDAVSRAVAAIDGRAAFSLPFVLEGGSIEQDGEGTLLTSRQCLLNPNRNGGATQDDVETALREALGVQRVLWVTEGLINDHTDGHIDTIARFVAPGEVVCMTASGSDDPNAAILDAIADELGAMTDAKGRRLVVHRMPSPGRVVDEGGRILPASHVNFLITPHSVIVPTYGTPYDSAAVAALEPLFPTRRVVGRSARAILSGGGAFHCISQQVPAEVIP